MKITALKTQLVDLPLAAPITTAIHKIESLGCVCLSLETDQGLVGQSYLFTINATRLKSFNEMVNGFADLVVGRDPHYIGAIWNDIWQEINPTGHKGVTISALSTIDTACWDLVGKAAGKPLHQLFGACRDRVKTYASGGLWLSKSIDQLVSEAQQFIADGFRAMKVRVGSENQATDVDRVRTLREAVGPGIEIMVDANQAFTPKQAIRLGLALEEFNIAWFEEPVCATDLKGHAAVTRSLNMPIASGETEYTRHGMQSMITANACDVLMPDLQRIGGLSEMLKVAAIASANHLPISTHIFTEQSLCIAGSAVNCISVEHMPWFSPLFNEELEMQDGDILIPERPGTGFTFNQELLARYRLN